MPRQETLGQRIRRIRQKRGMSLAKVSGGDFSRAFLNQVELGRSQPSTRVLRVIAGRLGTEVDYLLEGRLPNLDRELALERARVLLARGQARRALAALGDAMGAADWPMSTDARLCEAEALRALGRSVSIPTDVGRTGLCYYWLHMHSGEPGIIHVEAPADRTFTLGDFFAVWGAWGGKAQPLDSAHVSSFVLARDQRLVVYVDRGSGEGPQLFTGDPKTIVLDNHEVITLEISPPTVVPPPPFTWPAGF